MGWMVPSRAHTSRYYRAILIFLFTFIARSTKQMTFWNEVLAIALGVTLASIFAGILYALFAR